MRLPKRWARRRQRHAGGGNRSPDHDALNEVLDLANRAAPPFRLGLNRVSAGTGAPLARQLLAADAVAFTDRSQLLAWSGPKRSEWTPPLELAREVISTGRMVATTADDGESLILALALEVDGGAVGTLLAYGVEATPQAILTCRQVSVLVSNQIALSAMDGTRSRLAAAEVRALRAQIGPHFVYNALTAIAMLMRTDPDRARELLVRFAEYTRYTFANNGLFTTLAEELLALETYLELEQARFGDRIDIQLRVAPEVLPVALPFLVLQPIVENAIRHGLEGTPDGGRLHITARDDGAMVTIEVDDDGAGADPDEICRHLAGDIESDHYGLSNIDERLRMVYGPDHGLVVETAPGAGMRVVVRVPKFHAGVEAPPLTDFDPIRGAQ